MSEFDQPGRKTSPWAQEAKTPHKMSPRHHETRAWGGIFVVILLILAAIGSGIFYFRSPAGPSVGLQIIRPDSQILVGDPFTLTVSFSNYSELVLKDAKVSLFLPDGVSFVGQSTDQRVMEAITSDVGPGSINQQSFNLIVTRDPQSVKHIVAKINYSTPQSATVFENSVEADLLVGRPAVGLTFTAPEGVLSGADFEVKINYINNTNHAFKNLNLKVSYPPIFQFKRSTVEPEAGKNIWALGDLAEGGNGVISVTGNMVGPEKAFFGFNGTLSAVFLGENYTINEQVANVAISSAPLSIAVALNNTQDYIARLGDTLNYTLTYTNNSDVVMQNVAISAKLIGAMYDFKGLPPNAPFNSLTNTLRWFAANAPVLASIAPGQSGSFEFSIRIKDAFPIRLLSDKNYTLKVEARIDSPSVPENTVAERSISVAALTTKIAGRIDFFSNSYWRDAASGILNKGIYPPKVDQPTQYTIHWKIINYATDVTNIKVSGYLPNGVRFTGAVKSNVSTSPSYDPNSGLVSWQIPALAATKGVIGVPVETIFQVEATPSINQINQNMPLVSEAKLEAVDSFTGIMLQVAAPAVDTSVPEDKTITGLERVVRQ